MDLVDATDLEMTFCTWERVGRLSLDYQPSGFGMFARISSVSGGMLGSANADGTISASYAGFPISVCSSMGSSAPGDTVTGSVLVYFGISR
jgi:hypothetical protein